MFRSSNVEKLIDKATSNLLLEPDWLTTLQLCDLIRQRECNAKDVLQLLWKKVYGDNPHVTLHALLVLESLVKNCGAPVHDEICTRTFMFQFQDLAKTTPYENVKTKMLELLQTWAFAFRDNLKYRVVQNTIILMKNEGITFPALKESDAMFAADIPPTWADGESCHRCRTQFSVMTRKHHCRACGQVFCAQCSSKTSVIPKFGYEKEVRVCEACFASINRPPTAPPPKETDLPAEYLSSSLAQQSQTPARKTEEELKEEEDLQLALALSQSEAEEKEKEKRKSYGQQPHQQPHQQPQPQKSPQSNTHFAALKADLQEDIDPELARYLNRDYWEQRSTEERKKSSSPPTSAVSAQQASQQTQSIVKLTQNGNAEDSEIDNFVQALKSQVEIFVNRMKSNSSRGRNIANDSSVQTLFMNITAMHSRLLRYIQQQDDSRVYYEGLQDKLAQVKDARAALDALRFEHREKLRIQAEEAERLRQMQMAQKLDIMRQKKQEYLQYQRQLALQRIQEQEREMHIRQEQQKQQYLMGGAPFYMPAQGGAQAFPAVGGVPPFQAGGVMHPGVYPGGPNAQPPPGQPYLAYPPRFGPQMPQGMMPGGMMGGPQTGPVPPGQPMMGPGGQMVQGPPTSQVGPVATGPTGMPLPGPQQGQMGPPVSQSGAQPGQMGPPPGQMGPPGPHPGQMGPHLGPGQMGALGLQAGQMIPPGQQPAPVGPPGSQLQGSQSAQMIPNGLTNQNPNVGQGIAGPPQPEDTKKTEELISFD